MLTSEDRQYLLELEEAIRKKELSAMVAWAVFWTVEHPEELLSARQTERILEYYKLGIENGDALSCLNLGALYYTGSIVEQDFSKAVGLYQMAAKLAEEEGFIQSWILLLLWQGDACGLCQSLSPFFIQRLEI